MLTAEREIALQPAHAQLRTALFIALVTLAAVAVAYCTTGGAMFSPGELNAAPRKNVALGGVRSHAEIGGRCAACHAGPWSSESEADRCQACHTDIRQQRQQQLPLHGRLANGERCRDCHSEHNGRAASLVSLDHFDHAHTAFPLTGKHLAAACNDCHKNQVFQGTSQTCGECHARPKSHLGQLAGNCSACHGTSTFQSGSFDHAHTAFPLSGKHATTACNACHKNQIFAGTAQTCLACHAQPPSHVARFEGDCASCHSTNGFKRTTFDHAHTAFPLTGKHLAAACTACHKNQVYKGTAQTCSACHAEPPSHAGRFAGSCASCHVTSTFKGATFDHTRTAFPLTGKHLAAACAECHKNQQYIGTSQTCAACHAQPQNHVGHFEGNCAACHATTAWTGAKFDHTFPLNHGGARRDAKGCALCHDQPNDYRAYTCYGCHKHDPERTAAKHRRLNAEELKKCAVCHPGGREHGERGERGERETRGERRETRVELGIDFPLPPNPNGALKSRPLNYCLKLHTFCRCAGVAFSAECKEELQDMSTSIDIARFDPEEPAEVVTPL